MIYSGTTRRFDDLGRIHIPKEVRKVLFGGESEGMQMDIFYEKDGTIILRPCDVTAVEETAGEDHE